MGRQRGGREFRQAFGMGQGIEREEVERFFRTEYFVVKRENQSVLSLSLFALLHSPETDVILPIV